MKMQDKNKENNEPMQKNWTQAYKERNKQHVAILVLDESAVGNNISMR